MCAPWRRPCSTTACSRTSTPRPSASARRRSCGGCCEQFAGDVVLDPPLPKAAPPTPPPPTPAPPPPPKTPPPASPPPLLPPLPPPLDPRPPRPRCLPPFPPSPPPPPGRPPSPFSPAPSGVLPPSAAEPGATGSPVSLPARGTTPARGARGLSDDPLTPSAPPRHERDGQQPYRRKAARPCRARTRRTRWSRRTSGGSRPRWRPGRL